MIVLAFNPENSGVHVQFHVPRLRMILDGVLLEIRFCIDSISMDWNLLVGIFRSYT